MNGLLSLLVDINFNWIGERMLWVGQIDKTTDKEHQHTPNRQRYADHTIDINRYREVSEGKSIYKIHTEKDGSIYDANVLV